MLLEELDIYNLLTSRSLDRYMSLEKPDPVPLQMFSSEIAEIGWRLNVGVYAAFFPDDGEPRSS